MTLIAAGSYGRSSSPGDPRELSNSPRILGVATARRILWVAAQDPPSRRRRNRGRGANGELGHGDTEYQLVPKQIEAAVLAVDEEEGEEEDA